jgi:hypothetical protein
LLVNTVAGALGPDGVLGVETRPGLAEVVNGEHRVGEVAATPQGRSFIFVPAGQASLGMERLSAAASFRHLVRAAGRGGTLLLHVAEVDLPQLLRASAAGDDLDFDGLVLLGEAAVPPDLPAGVRLLARVETEAPAPEPPPGRQPAEGRKPGFTRPSRTPAIVAGGGARRRPRSRFERFVDDIRKRGAGGAGGVAAVWLVAVVAVWLVPCRAMSTLSSSGSVSPSTATTPSTRPGSVVSSVVSTVVASPSSTSTPGTEAER